MERKFRWELSYSVSNVKLLLEALDREVLCLGDKIKIKVEEDGNYSAVYTTDDTNDSTDDEIMELMDDYGFDCEKI